MLQCLCIVWIMFFTLYDINKLFTMMCSYPYCSKKSTCIPYKYGICRQYEPNAQMYTIINYKSSEDVF